MIPAYHTDYIFAVICEEMGIIVGLCVIARCTAAFDPRHVHRLLPRRTGSPRPFGLGCTVYISLQAFIILAGSSADPADRRDAAVCQLRGSSMLTGLIAVAILQVVAAQNGRRREEAAGR